MNILLIVCTAVFTIGCGNFFRDKSGISPSLPEESSSLATIEFQAVKQKIFDPHCVNCHSNYANFSSVKSNVSGILSSVEKGRMPKNSAPLEEPLKILLRTWIAEGANEFLSSIEVNEPEEIDDSILQPTWTSISRNIFDSKCLVCHSPTGQAPWVDLSSRTAMAKTLLKHINFKNPDESNLIIRLRDPEEPMPPPPPQSNIPMLTEQEVLVIIDWINAGVP